MNQRLLIRLKAYPRLPSPGQSYPQLPNQRLPKLTQQKTLHSSHNPEALTTSATKNSEVTSINILLLASKFDVAQSHFIIEPVDIDAKVTLNCGNSNVYIIRTLFVETASTVLSEAEENQYLSLKILDLFLGLIKICLKVPPKMRKTPSRK